MIARRTAQLAVMAVAVLCLACRGPLDHTAAPTDTVPDQHDFVRAIADRNAALVEAGLEAGIDPNARDRFGNTALCMAAFRGDGVLVGELLAKGADPDFAGMEKKTALHWAAMAGEREIANTLLDSGANLHARDGEGRTPLMYAAQNGRLPTARLLVNAGADPRQGDRDGWTPLMLAVSVLEEPMVRFLVDAGADPFQSNGKGENALQLSLREGVQEFFLAEEILARFPAMRESLERQYKTVLVNGDSKPDIVPEALAEGIFEFVNNARERAGRGALSLDSQLAGLAADLCDALGAEAEDGRAGNRMNSAELQIPGRVVTANSYSGRTYSAASAEVNKGTRFLTCQWLSPEALAMRIVTAWVNDRSHREVMLGDGLLNSGVGVALTDDHRVKIVQIFSRPEGVYRTEILNRSERPEIVPDTLVSEILESVNAERANRGLHSLEMHAALQITALEHSRDMVARGFFGHVNPDGENPVARVKRRGISLVRRLEDYELELGVGENLLVGSLFSRTVTETRDGVAYVTRHWVPAESLPSLIVAELMRSKGNRANLLSKDFDRLGMGIVFDAEDRFYLTQDFLVTERFEEVLKGAANNLSEKPVLDFDALSRGIHELVNRERLRIGLNPLTLDPRLSEIAAAHSGDMASRDYLAHLSPEGEDVTARARRAGFRKQRAIRGPDKFRLGENLFRDRLFQKVNVRFEEAGAKAHYTWYDAETIARNAVDGWLGSPAHRDNLHSPVYRIQGIGLAVDDRNRIYVTQALF